MNAPAQAGPPRSHGSPQDIRARRGLSRLVMLGAASALLAACGMTSSPTGSVAGATSSAVNPSLSGGAATSAATPTPVTTPMAATTMTPSAVAPTPSTATRTPIAATPTPSAATPTPGPSTAAVVMVGMATVNGAPEQVLTEANGWTLYYNTYDTATSMSCTGSCAGTWPPLVLTSGQPTSSSSLPNSLTTYSGGNGRQVEYDGHPLYRYSGDNGADQSNGEGAGGIWYVATPSL